MKLFMTEEFLAHASLEKANAKRWFKGLTAEGQKDLFELIAELIKDASENDEEDTKIVGQLAQLGLVTLLMERELPVEVN